MLSAPNVDYVCARQVGRVHVHLFSPRLLRASLDPRTKNGRHVGEGPLQADRTMTGSGHVGNDSTVSRSTVSEAFMAALPPTRAVQEERGLG